MNNINNSQADWNKLLDRFPEANFLQSWEWGEFNRNLGNRIYRIAIPATKGVSFCGCFLGIVENAKRGRYLTVPGGPLLLKWDEKYFGRAVCLMKEIAIKEKCSFIRVRPQVFEDEIATACGRPRNDMLYKFGFRPAPMHLHAELTRILDLTKNDAELLTGMRKTTRYEIKKSLKMGIKVYQSDDERLIGDFIRLQAETATREKFVPFSREYLLEQFRAFRKTGKMRFFYINQPHVEPFKVRPSKRPEQFLGSDLDSLTDDKIISMAFVIFYRGEAVYHYAASSDIARKLPAAYAIQWAIIQEAKKRGCKTYNLWGDVTDDQLGKHRFSGPSLFKRGFGGKQISYLPAHDLPLDWKYWPDWGVEKLRSRFRNLT